MLKKPYELFTALRADNHTSSRLKLVVLILERENARIMEILNASWLNYFPGKFLILKGSKGSEDIIIRDVYLLSEINKLPRGKEEKIFSNISYRTVYNFIKKNYSHLFIPFKTKKNYKVTHGFRYLNAKLAPDVKARKAILHHSSLRSGKYYSNLPADK